MLVNTSTADGRIMFIPPKQKDFPEAGYNLQVEFINKEIESCSRGELRRSDILSVWAGLCPLIGDPNSQCCESLVRILSITSEIGRTQFYRFKGGKIDYIFWGLFASVLYTLNSLKTAADTEEPFDARAHAFLMPLSTNTAESEQCAY